MLIGLCFHFFFKKKLQILFVTVPKQFFRQK